MNAATAYGQINIVTFNPNDGINAAQVINTTWVPDYLVMINDESRIVSRWFVIEARYTREGQYQCSLRRDLIADFYDEVTTAPTFIEKATLDVNDPGIFNSENMTFNQIKQSEMLLKDRPGVPWIVGYIARDYVGGEISIPQTVIVPDIVVRSVSEYEYYQYTSEPFKGAFINYNFNINVYSNNFGWAITFDRNGNPAEPLENFIPSGPDQLIGFNYNGNQSPDGYAINGVFTLSDARVMVNRITDKARTIDWNALNPTAYTDLATSTELDSLLLDDGKILKTESNEYYRVHVKKGAFKIKKWTIAPASGLGSSLTTARHASDKIFDTSRGSKLYELQATYYEYRVELELITNKQYTLTIGAHRPLVDAPYDMFYMPAAPLRILGIDTYTDLYLRLATEMATKLESNLYDLQLLPYCPAPNNVELDVYSGDPLIRPDTDAGAISYVTDSDGNNIGAVMWANQSVFSADLRIGGSAELPLIGFEAPTDPVEMKVADACTMYRIVSPNFNGAFEISLAKNRGLKDFTANCTYRPYSPYIKVAPTFSGLYGESFDDVRGLICGGDFSLPIVSDAWVQYQINNKNYQVMFDRQIEHLELKNNVQRSLEVVNVAAGTLSAAASGGIAGSMFGPGGAAIGTVVGGAASLAGGIADIALNEHLRSKAIEYTIDQFGYSLGNIQAMPQSLTKVSSFNKDNRIFPFIEAYSATEVEKEALRNKLKYNGMTVMRIGKIAEFIRSEPTYIKGKVIRLEGIDEEYHMAKSIAEEINKGVYI